MLAAFFYALTTVTSQKFPSDVPTPAINLLTNVAALIGGKPSDGGDGRLHAHRLGRRFLLMAAMGMFGGIGVLFLIVAYRMTEPSNLSPFDYTGILYAFVIGLVFFDESPVEDLFPGLS